MFDHFCPYIGNTIGGANYAKFLVFCVLGMLGVCSTAAAAAQYLLHVSSRSVLAWVVLIDFIPVSASGILMNYFHSPWTYTCMHACDPHR